MGALVRDLRQDLAMPHLLLIQVGLASGLGQYTEVVREAQKGLKLRNVRFVDAMGLPFQDGHLHLNTQAQKTQGVDSSIGDEVTSFIDKTHDIGMMATLSYTGVLI
ncbi:hypothetical protein TRIUR3_26338 [Triticum urartu]|uniref:Sialate O-acetylesterase domain-containing protein n=2 Tax=Triticum TaxID=4564 RepID=A0A9R0SP66_TRITD|nr:hypothetical protein TRIUR3_26338 [Triticum urartu]VAH96446.1 unnamed protein product [Triticum turgidum subsp. durum]